MDTVRSSKTLMSAHESTRRRKSEEHHRQIHRRENLKKLTHSCDYISAD